MGKKKLNARQRTELLKDRKKGLSYSKLAKLYNLNVKSVYEIVLNKAVDKSKK